MEHHVLIPQLMIVMYYGSISAYNGGSINIKINNVTIGSFYHGDNSYGNRIPINYLLKKGDKIDFECNGNNLKQIYAYGLN